MEPILSQRWNSGFQGYFLSCSLGGVNLTQKRRTLVLNSGHSKAESSSSIPQMYKEDSQLYPPASLALSSKFCDFKPFPDAALVSSGSEGSFSSYHVESKVIYLHFLQALYNPSPFPSSACSLRGGGPQAACPSLLFLTPAPHHD